MLFPRRFWLGFAVFFTLLFALPVASAFTIKRIQFIGLQRISPASARNYLPIKVGQDFKQAQSQKLIQALYQTGFFSQISLSRRGDALVVTVKERQTIGSFSFSGNSEITSKQIKPVLKSLSLQAGDVFYPYKLHQFVASLQQQYRNMGYYAATVKSSQKMVSRNRVVVSVKVHEGAIAKVNRITISGNKVFSQRTLLKQFSMTTPGLLTLITHSDRYSPAKLAADLQSLGLFYANYGYLNFRVDSQNITALPNDKTRINIALHVSEGPIFRIGSVKLEGKAGSNPNVVKRVDLKRGQVFSRKKIMAINKSISHYFSDQGYAQPQVLVSTQLNRQNNTVNLVFNIDSKSRVYIRRINFIGNDHSQDFALRSVVKQMEGSVYSQALIDESKQQISLLPYFQLLGTQVVPVPGKPGEVDLNFTVKKLPAGSFILKGGYGDIQKFFYQIGVSQQNFLGTGKSLGLSFQSGSYQSAFTLNYIDPMFTLEGISQTVSVSYSKMTPTKVGLGDYDMDDIGLSLSYGIPITARNRINLGFGYDYTKIAHFNDKTGSPIANDFLQRYGSTYNQLKLTLGWSYENRDRIPFPTSGSFENLALELGVPIQSKNADGKGYQWLSLGYYKVTFNSQMYFPLGKGFIIDPHLTIGYGNGYAGFNSMPFFLNFYGGGPTTLPGYQPSSLGPKNPNSTDSSDPLGGNFETFTGVNFIFPNMISDNLRTALFVAAGNIFETTRASKEVAYEPISLGNMRSSAGLLVGWNLPLIGTLDFAIAKAFNTKKGDNTATFGFTIGSIF